jgi:hypothetical protein
MRAEKIENVDFSSFSALIFLPAYLTNDRNSSNRELLEEAGTTGVTGIILVVRYAEPFFYKAFSYFSP